jgi:hypothetical protein
MDFGIPKLKDEEEMADDHIRKIAEMLAERRAGRQPVENTEPVMDDISAKQSALRSIAGEPDYAGMDLGEQPEEDIVAPGLPEEATGEPIMEEDKLAKLRAIQKMLAEQR